MIKRIAIAVVLWIVALYTAHAGAVTFSGEVASGGERKGYAEDISCARNWWVFGLLWTCKATVVADDDGRRHSYVSDDSGLTPDDIGKQVPMTRTRVGSGMSSGSWEWGLAENHEPRKGLAVLSLLGVPAVALFITFRMFRTRKTAT
ncbi:DUF6346 domain-containing protein [Lentzea sp. NBRC 102530]|uniref:DUF6346 domain-containing protein n=1 Tax=Lentzea sp. NBRC 102530 TaxID=3032201 RepID=UPI0024A179F2|nr:DUF6346 domain-containing protein [Lentzea sp. NBRC 102530]GLY48924.1 hypothetical protein Lesp01_25800 [Lentzea sp. NBRC 102530]